MREQSVAGLLIKRPAWEASCVPPLSLKEKG